MNAVAIFAVRAPFIQTNLAKLGPVVQKPISINPRYNFRPYRDRFDQDTTRHTLYPMCLVKKAMPQNVR